MSKLFKTEVWYKGYDAKMHEIEALGWVAARDEFNRVYPPGKRMNHSPAGLQYAYGEFQALADKME